MVENGVTAVGGLDFPTKFNINPFKSEADKLNERRSSSPPHPVFATHAHIHLRVRAEIIGHSKACMTEIYLHIDARMADYIRAHP